MNGVSVRAGVLMLGLALCTARPVPEARAQPPADVARGQALFAAKQCARCHHPRGERGMGPPVEQLRRAQGAYELAGRFWNHAPAMFTITRQENVAWPQFTVTEMADLMMFLRAEPDRDPAPDPFVGRAVLISKGCLKCHTYRKEGARLGPDLAERRELYAPAATWAAAIWAHTPRMAAAAIERGVLYPRFSGGEMAQLLAFLRGK